MRIPTEAFEEKVKAAWGNPDKVADVGIDEIFQHEDIGFDHDDQVSHAKRIGVIAGLTAVDDPEAFIQKFTVFLNEA